jgi:spore maturation protein CgeB
MRIYLIDDFKEALLRASLTFAHKLQKGLLSCGHDVLPFSYRDVQRQHSIFTYCDFLPKLNIKATIESMTGQIQNYRPDVVIFRPAVRKLDEQLVLAARRAAPNATFVCWSISLYSGVHPNILACAKHADIFISSSAGQNLRQYKDAGVSKCAYMPYPCDPALEYRHKVDARWETNVLYTGQTERELPDQDPMRKELIRLLIKQKGLKVWGCEGQPRIFGMDYIYAVSGAKIGISINAYNNIRLYHSNRFMNYLACGTMVLAKYVPDSELLFADGKHLRYFETPAQCMELIDYYLSNPRERLHIADAGMNRAHEQFSCKNIAEDFLTLLKTGSYGKAWSEVI